MTLAGRINTAGRKPLTRARGNSRSGTAKVPGPSSDPSTNLVLTDVAIRMASYVMRGAIEKRLLKGRYGKNTASEIIKNRSIGQTLATVLIAKFATRSIPGAALVSTGMAAKVLMDRSKARHRARAQGDKDLIKRARD